MKLVVEIDEATYKDIKKGKIYSSFRDVPLESVNAIANGTPLSNLRAEIQATIDEERTGNGNINKGVVIGLQMALDIIDKYKAESWDKE